MSEQEKKGLVPERRFPEFRDKGVWKLKTLGAVFTSVANGLSLEQKNDNAGYKVTRIETISDKSIDINKVGYVLTEQDISAHRLCIGDILFSNINSISHIGKVAFVDRDYDLYHGMNLLRLVPNTKSNSPLFLYYQLNTRRLKSSFEERANKAINQASINQTELKKTILSVPLLVEQQKIADCLTSIDALITAQCQKRDGLKAHKKGLMQQLFPAEGETLPKLRFPEFRDKGEWKVEQAGFLFSNRVEQGEDGLPIYSVTMNDGLTRRSSLDRKIDNISDSSGNKKACLHDIVYNMMRMWQGASGVVIEDCMVSPAYVVLAPGDEVCADFYGYYFKKPQCLRLLTSHSQGLTKDRLRLYFKDFAKIPLPCPQVSEQQKIADCLTSIDELITAQTQKIEALKAHKKGLMQQLFPSFGGVAGEA